VSASTKCDPLLQTLRSESNNLFIHVFFSVTLLDQDNYIATCKSHDWLGRLCNCRSCQFRSRSEAGFNNTERMDDQQWELELLKLKFQKSEAARENQWGEIESLKKQGEESNVVG